MSVVSTLRAAKSSNWKDCVLSLIFNLIGALTPVWFGWFLLRVFTRHPGLGSFTSHGEFAIYSAALLSPGIYVIMKDEKYPAFPGKYLLGLLSLIALILATGFFSAVTTAFLEPTPLLNLDQVFLIVGTVVLFCVSIVLAFTIALIDAVRMEPDFVALNRARMENLNAEFDKLAGH